MQLRFNDFDAYKAAAEGWGLEFVQLDCGPLDATLTMAQSTRVLIVNTTLNRAFHQQGEAPVTGRTFGLYARTSASAGIRWLDRDFGTNTLAVFPSDRAYEAWSTPGKDVHALTIDQGLLEDVSEITGLQKSIEMLPRHGGVFSCAPADMAALRNTISAMFRISPRSQIAQSILEYEIAHRVLAALARGNGEQRPPMPRKRDRAFSASMDLIHDNSADGLTIPGLCRAVGASERTLRYAFGEKTGVSPKAYIAAVQLNRARSELLEANARDSSIRHIASNHGFWHMGQFASDYRKMFGERPSDTLKR